MKHILIGAPLTAGAAIPATAQDVTLGRFLGLVKTQAQTLPPASAKPVLSSQSSIPQVPKLTA